MKDALGFPELLERFFTQRLMAQRRASSHTIAIPFASCCSLRSGSCARPPRHCR